MRQKHDQAPAARGKAETVRDTVPQKVELSLESTSSQTMRGVRVIDGSSSGYNPYDTVPNASASTGMQRLEEMRRLSEWIRLKRELEREPDKD